jgi:hypothetical protein
MNSRLTALRSGIEYLLSHGVTTIHDIVDGPEEVQAYQTLKALGQLRVRVQLLIRGIESQIPVESFVALGLQQGFGDDWLKIGGVKFSIDGIETARNAATYDAYPGQPWNRGIIRIPADELEEKVLLCHRNGVRVAIHAIGPRAVDSALDAIEKALREVPRGDHRHRIEHGYLPGPSSQLPRMARLGVVASPQVSFLYGLGDSWIRVWGVENLTGAMPLQSMLSLGIKVMGSTDYPCVPVDPFLGVKSAVVRRTRNGVVLGEREAINVQEAVRLQTTGAAFGGFEELHKGSLEVGKLADCIVVSQDPWTVPADQLDSIEVMLTVVNGQVEFERSPSVLG